MFKYRVLVYTVATLKLFIWIAACVYFLLVLRMEILLSTEQEEKQLLKSELEKVQEAARREQAELRREVDKVTRGREGVDGAQDSLSRDANMIDLTCIVDREGKKKAR